MNYTSDDKTIAIKDILQYLPHRHPFLLIDKVLDYTLHERLIAIKNVSYTESFFNGHFPGNPVMPGVLIIESMAQSACVLASLSTEGYADPKMGNLVYLSGINKARFRKPVYPGDIMNIEVVFIKRKFYASIYECSVKVDNSIIATSEILCSQKKDNK